MHDGSGVTGAAGGLPIAPITKRRRRRVCPDGFLIRVHPVRPILAEFQDLTQALFPPLCLVDKLWMAVDCGEK
jgi:hypothetical protein